LDSRYNGPLLSEIAKPLHVIRLPYLGKVHTAREVTGHAKRLRNPLRKISKLVSL
jgi:hypothetical protein